MENRKFRSPLTPIEPGKYLWSLRNSSKLLNGFWRWILAAFIHGALITLVILLDVEQGRETRMDNPEEFAALEMGFKD